MSRMMKIPFLAISVTCIGICSAVCGGTQVESPVKHSEPKIDLAATYDGIRVQSAGGGGFGMQGIGVDGHVKLIGQFGLAVNAAAVRKWPSDPPPELDLMIFSAGPRLTETRLNGRFEFFVQSLVGKAIGTHGVFPCATGVCSRASSLEVQTGYGVDMRIRRDVLVRIAEADWVYTELPNSSSNTQNSFRVTSGIVFRFH
jgi:hypothetical protein